MIDGMGIVKRRSPDGRGRVRPAWILAGLLAMAPLLSACGSASLPDAPLTLEQDGGAADYRISPLKPRPV